MAKTGIASAILITATAGIILVTRRTAGFLMILQGTAVRP